MPELKVVESYAARALNPERLKALETHGGESVLDVGCGNGAYVYALEGGRRTAGVDYMAFEAWQARPELFHVADATALPFEDASFDTVASFETLEHLPDPAAALKEFHRVCRKNLILTVPNCEVSPGMRQSNLIYHHWIDPTHVNFYDLEGICRAVEAAGFHVTERKTINQISLAPLLMEALGLGGVMTKVAAKALAKVQRRRYAMTSLVVAEKR